MYALLLGLGAMGLVFTIVALEIQAGLRAYEASASRWTSAQEEAIHSLERYSHTAEPGHAQRARQALTLPLAKMRARRAMEQSEPDRTTARDALTAAGSHPDEVTSMVSLFIHLPDIVPYLDDAIRDWRATDPYIQRLDAIADRLDEPNQPNSETMRALRQEVRMIAAEIRPLRDGVLRALGQGSRWVNQALQLAAGLVIALVTIVAIATFRGATRRIAASERKFRDTFEQAAVGMAQVTSEGTFVAVNQALCNILGWPRDELVGYSFTDLLHPDQDPASLQHLLGHAGDRHVEEYQLIGRGNTPLWCKLSISNVDRAWHGHNHLILSLEDVTEARQLLFELHYQARHDALTGLINRREFEDRLTRAQREAQSHGARHALCFIDLDQFKVVNDTCGHPAGDALLQEIARLLERELRQTDVLARLGGDEFGVILRDCDDDAAMTVAEKLRSAVDEYVFTYDEALFRIGASVGWVPIDKDAPEPSGLLQAADTACYMAKDFGRNRVVRYSAEDMDLQARHSEMNSLTQIRAALASDRFVLHAQHIRPADGDGPLRYEVLVRMLNADGNTIPPGRFLPAAERYQVASEIDRWVVENTLETLARYPSHLDRLEACHINLSGQSIGRSDFLDFLEQSLDRSPVAPEKLCFEITETAAVASMGEARNFFHRLRHRGCRFALDDFGSGLSSFGYLNSMPVEIVKIDGVFVRDLLDNDLHQAMVRSIGEIAGLMGKRTVAEFVETAAVAARLHELGIDLVQGYGIHRPCPLDALIRQTETDAAVVRG